MRPTRDAGRIPIRSTALAIKHATRYPTGQAANDEVFSVSVSNPRYALTICGYVVLVIGMACPRTAGAGKPAPRRGPLIRHSQPTDPMILTRRTRQIRN